jgi:two-component system chemotaxis response regulator CheB
MVRIIVVGASQGGVPALQALVSGLPKDFTVPILIVQHIGSSQSILPSILNDVDGTRAAFGKDHEALRDGRIYVAPPDHHMQLQDGQVELTRGPRENYARPAIDPLFRTAALYYGPDVIGVVLTGRLNDGTAGLYEIKRQGGITVVQTPDEAEASDMPQSALDNVAVDYCVPVAEMPRLFARLTENSKQRSQFIRGVVPMSHEKLDQPSAQTCPECGGAMREEVVANLTRFRCHIGHAMTAEVLASTQLEKLDYHISAMLRTLNERAALCRDIAAKHANIGNSRVAETWKAAAKEAEQRELAARQLVDAGWTHPEASTETEE